MFFHSTKDARPQGKLKRRLFDSTLATVGYILSPLSWWNDLIVNVPLSYAFSYPFTLLDKRLFVPAFIVGYWLSNLLGFLLLHRGVSGLFNKQKPSMSVRKSIVVAMVYTLIIVLLVWLGWIPAPVELLHGNK
jgi:hypothetical protein